MYRTKHKKLFLINHLLMKRSYVICGLLHSSHLFQSCYNLTLSYHPRLIS